MMSASGVVIHRSDSSIENRTPQSSSGDVSFKSAANDPITRIHRVNFELARHGDKLHSMIYKDTWVCVGTVWLIFLVGSFAHDFLDVPSSYFSNTRNFLNVFFVKWGWGWTFTFLMLYHTSRAILGYYKNGRIVFNYVGRLLVTTALWFMFTKSFLVLEGLTGTCKGADLHSQQSCLQKGHLWSGFDISGHAFLLSFAALVINEELHDIRHWHAYVLKIFMKSDDKILFTESKQVHEYILILISEVSAIALSILQFVWMFMLFWTCLYFHTVSQKLIGLSLGLTNWYVCYRHLFVTVEPLQLISVVKESEPC